MNVIETTQKIVSEYPEISKFTNEVDIDFTSNEPTSFGLSSTGDTLVKEYLTGKQIRQHNFVLYATQESFNSFKRLNNSNFLIDFSYWLETQKNIKITKGKILRMWTSNGMAYQVPTGDINDGVTYQIQIFVEYEKEEA